MRITRIELTNFGSYEGINTFNIPADPTKNIVLIGGKNGAGKTTLFTAIKLCLYGYIGMGYKNQNAYYARAVTKMINNNAKFTRPAHAGIELDLDFIEGRDLNHYRLLRHWSLADSLKEEFLVFRNEKLLDESEVADFEKYISSLMPPDLFNLYFFDGEKIADFFLEEGGNGRIRDAFLILCGYDTFDIMESNFRRLCQRYNNNDLTSNNYFKAESDYLESQKLVNSVSEEYKQCLNDIQQCDADLVQLDREYNKSGGLTLDEWNERIGIIKEEEIKRERLNTWLKKIANDTVPFLILSSELDDLKKQIECESASQKYKDFCEILCSPVISKIAKSKKAKDIIQEMNEAVLQMYEQYGSAILNLSSREESFAMITIDRINAFDRQIIIDTKKQIKQSIAKCAKIKKELEKSSVDTVQNYMSERNNILERKNLFFASQIQLEGELRKAETRLIESENAFKAARLAFETSLKNASVSDISSKAVLMLKRLQQSLYSDQIERMRESFLHEFSILIRKHNFIDDIRIDNDFNIHLYRNTRVSLSSLKKAILANDGFDSSLAYISLFDTLGAKTNSELIQKLWNTSLKSFVLPLEVEKSSMSNGEKQIFIMALYKSLVGLCNSQVPFIIDTPFARIDTEHRANITKNFFTGLKGQVFILSTNEEIEAAHVEEMKNNISAAFLLENDDNTRTYIHPGKYFEV